VQADAVVAYNQGMWKILFKSEAHQYFPLLSVAIEPNVKARELSDPLSPWRQFVAIEPAFTGTMVSESLIEPDSLGVILATDSICRRRIRALIRVKSARVRLATEEECEQIPQSRRALPWKSFVFEMQVEGAFGPNSAAVDVLPFRVLPIRDVKIVEADAPIIVEAE